MPMRTALTSVNTWNTLPTRAGAGATSRTGISRSTGACAAISRQMRTSSLMAVTAAGIVASMRLNSQSTRPCCVRRVSGGRSFQPASVLR